MSNDRDMLIAQHLLLAKKLAWQKCRTTPHQVTYEELESAAYLGLVEAATRFDPTQGVAFGFYATRRISGAILDYLRELDWCSRNSDVKIDSIDVSTDDYPLAGLLESNEKKDNSEEFFEEATKVIDELGKRVIGMYYLQNRSLKEIGSEIGVGESRASQLLKKYRTILAQTWDYDVLVSMAA